MEAGRLKDIKKMIELLKANWKPATMIVLLIIVYLLRKFAPLSKDEIELIEGIWAALSFGAVFTPNFNQREIGEP